MTATPSHHCGWWHSGNSSPSGTKSAFSLMRAQPTTLLLLGWGKVIYSYHKSEMCKELEMAINYHHYRLISFTVMACPFIGRTFPCNVHYLEASSRPSCHCSCQRMATRMSSSETMIACFTRSLLCSCIFCKMLSAASRLLTS